MSVAHAVGQKRVLVSRLLAALMMAVLTWAHPVEAAVLHYCSHAGRVVDPVHDCCKPQAAVACCLSHTNLPATGLSLASAACSDCCEVFTIAELDPFDALFSSASGDFDFSPRSCRPETDDSLERSSSLTPLDLLPSPPGRSLYLLFCRILR